MSENKKPHKWRDTAWKKALTNGGRSAIEYFMPDLAADMDLTRELTGTTGVELQKSDADSDNDMRVLDVLFDVPLKEGKNGDLALFIEQQHDTDEDFALRMVETYVRLKELKRHNLTTGFAIFTGNSPDMGFWFDSCYGFEVSVKYRTFHLPSRNLEELRKDRRPFAQVMLAGRLSLDAGDDPALRERYAWEILNRISEQEYSLKDQNCILDFTRRILWLDDAKINPKLREVYKMKAIKTVP
ncbi:MAG: Rpn family recombination-promoting nuclease/putative transposase, partial [Synergistaceae bacterium]|nr:Rpn family recombination-promoting nuclease/putative transposase [Synergistaceae bacterium]